MGRRLEPWRENWGGTRLGPGQGGWKISLLLFSLLFYAENLLGKGRQQEEHQPKMGRREVVEGCPQSLSNGLPLCIAKMVSSLSQSRHQIRLPRRLQMWPRSCWVLLSHSHYPRHDPTPPGTRPLFWAPKGPVGSSSWCRINN